MSSILDIEHVHPTHPAHRVYRERAALDRSVHVRHLAVVPAPAEPEIRDPELRLTRRGRVAVFLSAVLMLAILGVVLGSTTVATDGPGAPVPAAMVTVEPGQTLWDIAAEANPNGDGQQTVSDIMRLNSIESAGGLQAGDTIAVPLYR